MTELEKGVYYLAAGHMLDRLDETIWGPERTDEATLLSLAKYTTGLMRRYRERFDSDLLTDMDVYMKKEGIK